MVYGIICPSSTCSERLFESSFVINRKWLDDVIGERTSLLKTAIAGVIAFITQALAANPPSQNWYDAAAKLGTCAVEDFNILRNIPETIQKERIKR